MPSNKRPASPSTNLTNGRPARGLPPDAALEHWSDPEALLGMMEYVDSAHKMTDTPEGRRRHLEYARRRHDIEIAFLNRLRSGEVLASAIAQSADEREVIPLSVWELVEVDYEVDRISGEGRIYERPEFFEPSAIPSNVDKIPTWVSALPSFKPHNAVEMQAIISAIPILFALDGRSVLFNGGIILTDERAEVILKLLPLYERDHADDREPAQFQFLKAEKLADDLDSNETALRRLIARIREQLAAEFKQRLGLVLDIDDVIENARWKGYRLNPKLIQVKPFQLIARK